ncbi:hypothetical protein LSTR_LSTR014310 [Laodelphax striatellus]|uniref:RNA methyltransferase bin3 C-terminal domain-containing protein n=1 Tax=Laodelphax striatellus TaxID=195883 RepID=A0A482X1Q1_LAOST|nr:hypothetical protein LSTR_LSTR014310 [Laodelphax striatellus]
MYAQLRPGGRLHTRTAAVALLQEEAQFDGTFIEKIAAKHYGSSERRLNNLGELKDSRKSGRNYKSIELFPHKFSQFLLSEVGFAKCELVGTPHHHKQRAFSAPSKLFTKGQLNSAPGSVRVTHQMTGWTSLDDTTTPRDTDAGREKL